MTWLDLLFQANTFRVLKYIKLLMEVQIVSLIII